MRQTFRVAILGAIATALAVSGAIAQPKPADLPRASAVKLPDGGIVFISRNPDDADPTVEKIVLTPAEWKALQDQVEQARKLGTAKPVAPSRCAIRASVELRGEKPTAVLTVEFAVRTTLPQTPVILGLQRAQVTAARGEGNRLPILNPPGDDGLTAVFEAPGEHTLTLELEAAVLPRGRGEFGFEVGLPRAAITTLVMDKPPQTAAKKIAIGTRVEGKATEPKRVIVALDQMTRPRPLGATDTLELAWDPPTAAAPTVASVETDVVVRVDDAQIETTATMKLRGPQKDWHIALPAGSEVTATSDSGLAPATVNRPTDANRPIWKVRAPADPTSDWAVTVTTRQPRPKRTDPKFRGPYFLGPYSVVEPVQQSGKITVFAPPTARLGFKASADFRRQDVPLDGPLAVFQFNSLPTIPPTGKPPAWMELDARLVPAVARVRPAHTVSLRPDGWHWEAVVKVVPPPRGEVEQLLIDLPAGWETLTAKPEDIVDEVQVLSNVGPVRSRLIRLTAPQESPFELILTSQFPLPVAQGKVSLPLPRFPQTDERDGTITASVPKEYEVSGSTGGEPLKSTAGRQQTTTVSGELDRGVELVELAWQPHRPNIACDSRAEVTVTDQQLVVTQVLKFKTAGDSKPIRLRGPVAAVGLKSVPPLDPIGIDSGDWQFTPPTDAEFTLTLGYALRHPTRIPGVVSGELPVGLFSPVQTTRQDVTVRVWSAATGRRLPSFSGTGWRVLPPEPALERDILPTFTLAANGSLPLAVQWTEATDTGPAVAVDRGLLLVTLAEDGTAAVRGRYLLRRWPVGGVELELPADALADIYADGKKLDPQPGAPNPDQDERTVRLVLPDLKPGRTTCLLEIRYPLATTRTDAGARVLIPPVLRAAVYRTPTRWHVTAPSGAVTLFPSADWQPDTRWGWRGLGFAATAAVTPAELEQWFTAGTEIEAGEADSWIMPASGDAVAARQLVPDRITVVLVPRVGWIAGVSALAFLVGFLVSRLRSRWCGPAIAVIGVGLVIGAAVSPQPAAQVMTAAQPGLLTLGALLVLMSAIRWYSRRKVDRLPAFSRSRPSATAPAPTAPVPPSRSNRGASAEVILEPDSGASR